MNRRHAHQTIARLGKRAGISNVRCSPHTFRHTCALLFLQRGGDAISLQRILGHASLTMTRRYVFQTVDDLADSHRKSSPAFIPLDYFHTRYSNSTTSGHPYKANITNRTGIG